MRRPRLFVFPCVGAEPFVGLDEIRYGVLFFPKVAQEASHSAVTLFLVELNEFLPA